MFVLLIGWFRTINLLVLLGYLMVGMLLLNALAAARILRNLQVRRRIAQPIYAGAPCTTSIQFWSSRGDRLGVPLRRRGPAHRLSWFVDRLERDGRLLRGQVVLSRPGTTDGVRCWRRAAIRLASSIVAKNWRRPKR